MKRTFIQYHNAEKLGWVPFGERPFLQTDLGIFTRLPTVKDAFGGTVYLIVRLGTPGRYYLWDEFTVERVEECEGGFRAWGPGAQLVPPRRLEGEAFEAFRRACAWFVGFRGIGGLPYVGTLARLAEESRGAAPGEEAEAFCSSLMKWRPRSGDPCYFRGFVRAARGRHAEAALDFSEALRLGTEFHEQAAAGHALALSRC